MSGLVRAVAVAAATGLALGGGAGVAHAGGLAGGWGSCERGEFCAWSGAGFRGAGHRLSLESANPGECVPFPPDFAARSFANRMGRPVTVYQGRDCATEGEFDTYPGGGTFVPQAPYVIRAVQIWER